MAANKCFKCGTTEGRILKHHISYNPEVVVDCCMSCHRKIHHRVRKQNLCSLSIEETRRLSQNSNYKRNVKDISFSEQLIPRVKLIEKIYYRQTTGTVSVSSGIYASNRKHLHEELI